jgi:hypothetical protein
MHHHFADSGARVWMRPDARPALAAGVLGAFSGTATSVGTASAPAASSARRIFNW